MSRPQVRAGGGLCCNGPVSELVYLPAVELARLIATREVSASEVVRAFLGRIDECEPKLNAYAHLDREGALAAAARADRALAEGLETGRLHGVPLSIKSSIDVAGFRCECGSRFRQGYTAERDAPLVGRLRREGAIILGVTNTPDMLMAYETDNYLYGRTKSPWDLERTPGGSSGGEAAAIAGGCSAAGFGSDGGGSVRVPAHFSGLYGLKPTPGLIPRTGHWPACLGPSAGIGLIGPMARSAADLQLLLEVASGPEYRDPSSAPVEAAPPTGERLERVRIGWFEGDGVTPVSAEIRAAVRTAAERLAGRGFRVEGFDPPDFGPVLECWRILFRVAATTLTRPLVEGRESDIHPVSRDLFVSGEEAEAMSYPRFLAAWVDRDRFRAELLARMEEVDVLLCPTASITAFRHGEREWEVDGRPVRYPEVFGCSQIFNLLGNPALSAPVALSMEGLPIGVQIVGRHFEDPLVIAVAGELEASLGAWKRPRGIDSA